MVDPGASHHQDMPEAGQARSRAAEQSHMHTFHEKRTRGIVGRLPPSCIENAVSWPNAGTAHEVVRVEKLGEHQKEAI